MNIRLENIDLCLLDMQIENLDTEILMSFLQANCFKLYEKKDKELKSKLKEIKIMKGMIKL